MAFQSPYRPPFQRFRAILVGGLVLGLGATVTATVTAASRNAAEQATGSSSTAPIVLEGSTTGGSYSAPVLGSPAALPFTMASANLAPGDVIYSPFAIRLAANTERGTTVTTTSPSPTGSLAGLTYSLIRPSTFGCSAATTGETLIGSSEVGAVTGATTVALAAGTPSGAAGAPVFLCFVVTAGTGLVQTQAGAANWEFTASSS